MAKIDQRDALDVLKKPRLLAIAAAVGLETSPDNPGDDHGDDDPGL